MGSAPDVPSDALSAKDFDESNALIRVGQGIIYSVEPGLLPNGTRSNIDEMVRAFRYICKNENEIDESS